LGRYEKRVLEELTRLRKELSGLEREFNSGGKKPRQIEEAKADTLGW
jgi:hypothetical protein